MVFFISPSLALHTLLPRANPHPLLFVVSKLDGQSVADAAECCGLHLPVVDGVGEETDAMVESSLHSCSFRTEGVQIHLGDVVVVEVQHLESKSTTLVVCPCKNMIQLQVAVDSPVSISYPGDLWEQWRGDCCPGAALSASA